MSVPDAAGIASAAAALLADPAAARARVEAGERELGALRGSALRNLALIEGVIAPQPAR